MNIDEVKRRLKFMNLKAVASASGVHYNTVYRLVKDPSHEPRYRTIEKLSVWLESCANDVQ